MGSCRRSVQTHLNFRVKKYHRCFTPLLNLKPQRKCICVSFSIISPKKPNSAKRRIVKLSIRKLKRRVLAQIPGPGLTHGLKPYSRVLIRGGRTRDLIGIRYRVLRGVLDAAPVVGRKTSRSKYGVKRF